MDDVTRRLAELVALPSVNPMGRGDATGPPYYEGQVTSYLESFFRELGVRVDRVEVAPGRDNVLAYYEAPAPSRRILWDVHQDTVPVAGMTIPPFASRVEGGRLYGRGACDVKGTMASMLEAFARLVRERPQGSASIVLACTVDEEYTHIGSSLLARERPAVDLAVVAEPTSLDLVVAHKGAVRWKIATHGVACHSSSPERGSNAIYRMARVVGALEAHADELASTVPWPLLGPPSLSIGTIMGGVSANIVPDFCEIDIDRRLVPNEEVDAAIERVATAIRRRLGTDETFEMAKPWVYMPPLESQWQPDWIKAFSEVVYRTTGRIPERKGVPFGTDAGPLSASGLPCLVFGPGDIAQAHTRNEWIELEQVVQAAEIFYGLACALGE